MIEAGLVESSYHGSSGYRELMTDWSHAGELYLDEVELIDLGDRWVLLAALSLRWLQRADARIPSGDARIVLEQLGSEELLLSVRRLGAALVRVRWSPYWLAAGGCVERAGGLDPRDRGPPRLHACLHALGARADHRPRPPLGRRLRALSAG
jgi:hypothetical protein